MTELTVRRIVIACDAACDIRVAVEDAAALAKRCNAALHGVFLDDENLYRLARLPFGRQVTLSAAVFDSFSATDLEKHAAAAGAAMRRTVAAAAARRGLEWSFGIVRDLPSVAALAGIEGDVLIVQSATRPFSGSWHPRSSWIGVPEDYARTVLLRREPPTGAGTVLMLPTNGDDCEKVLLFGLAVAGDDDEVVVLLREGAPAEVDTVKRTIGALHIARRRTIRLDAAPPNMPELLRKIEHLKPKLVVANGYEANRHAVREVVAGTHCDVLIVRNVGQAQLADHRGARYVSLPSGIDRENREGS